MRIDSASMTSRAPIPLQCLCALPAALFFFFFAMIFFFQRGTIFSSPPVLVQAGVLNTFRHHILRIRVSSTVYSHYFTFIHCVQNLETYVFYKDSSRLPSQPHCHWRAAAASSLLHSQPHSATLLHSQPHRDRDAPPLHSQPHFVASLPAPLRASLHFTRT